MESSTYYKLNVVLKDLQSERNQLQGQIDENNLHIYETQSLALELLGKEEDDFKFFSPRKMKDLHRDELQQFDVKKSEYVDRNKALVAQRDKLDSIIDVLLKVSEEYEEDKKMNDNLDHGAEEKMSDDLGSEMEDETDSEKESEVHDDSDSEIYSDLDDWNIDEETGSEPNEDWNLSELDIAKEDKQKIADYLQNHVVDNLSDIKHRIELGDKFIRQDPMRTKQELTVVSKKLSDIIDNVKEKYI